MKKIFLTLCMALSLATAAWAGNPSGKIRTLVNDFRHEPGFEVVDMGGLALSLLRAAARTQVEDVEDRQALELFNGIKRLTVLDFSDADAVRKEKFLRRVRSILADEEILLEAKDDHETVRIYGLSSQGGSILEDIIFLTDDTLVSVRGTIRADQVGELIAQTER